jgi:hypothetical protein
MTAPAQDYGFQLPVEEQSPTAYVFFAADLIAPDVKAKVPAWAGGGALRPDSKCLAWNTGFIPRCTVTEMRQVMESVAASNVNPPERKHKIRTFKIVEGGEARQVGVRTGPTGETVHDGLLRSPFYPQEELPELTAKIDGLVQVPVRNRSEQAAANKFLCPDGTRGLPRNIAQLKQYFEGRAAAAASEFEANVAAAAISSCVHFESWGMQQINEANAEYDRPNSPGWSYGETHILCFEQLGVPRKDNVMRENAAQIDALRANQEQTNSVLGTALGSIAELLREQRSQPATAPTPQQVPDNLSAAPAPPAAEPVEIKIAVGDRVLVNGVEGVVEGKPFGKVKVSFGESSETVEKSEVTVIG